MPAAKPLNWFDISMGVLIALPAAPVLLAVLFPSKVLPLFDALTKAV